MSNTERVTWGGKTYDVDTEHPVGKLVVSTTWDLDSDERQLRSYIASAQRDLAAAVKALDTGMSLNGVMGSNAERVEEYATKLLVGQRNLTQYLAIAVQVGAATVIAE